VRELHYWLLVGRHGAAIRRLGWPHGHAQRVARAVALLRADFTRSLTVDRLAAAAGMSRSSFHQHFRAVTSLSSLQSQKQLRLIDARRLMMSEGVSARSAAFVVSYESVSQFTREYGRMFGLPPIKDTETVRNRAEAGGVSRSDCSPPGNPLAQASGPARINKVPQRRSCAQSSWR
jgi:AraC-like DNA-binding protein